jgi:RHS repeat-associated protein
LNHISSTLLDLSYQYQRCSCSTGGTGQITGIINNIDRNKDKNFEYDKLARLKKVSGGLNQSWTQIYNYDRYGNRTNVTSLGFEALRLNQQSISNNEEQDKLIKNSSPFITKDSLLNNVKGFLDEKTSNNQKQDSFKDLDKSDETNNTQSSNTTPNTQFDFDGDGKADFSTWRRKTGNLVAGTWSINNSQTGQTSNSQLGTGGNQIAPGDYDGDGKTDKATWNIDTGNWTIQNSSNGSVNTFQFGAKGDAIVPADYDGDHKTDLAIWRPSTGDWWIRRSSNNTTYSVNWGGQQFGDIPMVGDYDGDGLSDVSVWRPNGGNWYILVLPSSGGQVIYGQWGMIGDVPVPADYDGDHKTDFAVWRPSTGIWYVYQSSNGQYTATVIGSEVNRDVLVPADYDGDGKTDLAVWTPSSGLWNVRKSTTLSNSTFTLGTKDDVAVPSAYIRRSSSPKGQSVEIPNDGHGTLSFEATSNRISTTGFEYDLAGNQTRIVKEDGSKLRFQYDAAGRLIKVKTDSNQTLVTYTFGIGRERLITQEGDETSTNLTYYAWEGGSVIAEYTEAAGNVLVWAKNYIFMNGALLATQEKTATGESVQFDHPDQLGTRLVTNPANGTHFEQNTLPFGTALGSESTGSINRRFTSYDRSQTTGLDYAVNRFYDSSQGRFTTVDPIKMGASNPLNPQTLNLYSYTANDPVNRTDPSGLDWTNGIPTLSTVGWFPPRIGGQAGNSFFSGLGQFLSGFLGNLFGGSNSSIRRIPYQLNTGTITPAAPPPLPGAGTIKNVAGGSNFFNNDSDDFLNCPPSTTKLSWGAQYALDHYLEGSGRKVYIPLDEIQARFPLPTDFPGVAKLIKKGTGKKIFVNHQIFADSNPIQTSGFQAAILGRITFRLNGRLAVDKFGGIQFVGTVGMLTDTYDFDASKRGLLGELSTTVGRQLPGKSYKIEAVGTYDVTFERAANGKITQNKCTP